MFKIQTKKSKMKTSTVLLVWLVLLVGCVSPFEIQANARLDELDTILSTVPVIPGSTLIERYDDINRSREPRCATVSIGQILGTNDLTLQEVLEWYHANLNPIQWRINPATTAEGSYIYVKNEQVSLGIGDDYRWFPEMQDAVKRGQETFKNLFYININTFVDPAATRTNCT